MQIAREILSWSDDSYKKSMAAICETIIEKNKRIDHSMVRMANLEQKIGFPQSSAF